MWKNFFPRLLNAYFVSNVRHREIHTAEPLVPDLSTFEIEIAVEKLEKNISLGSDQIPAEHIQAAGETLRSEIYQLIKSV
jgi:hypothetical protein